MVKSGFKWIVILSFIALGAQSKEPEPVVEPIPGAINSRLQEFAPSLSQDGKTMYFYSKRSEKSYTNVYVSQLGDDGLWAVPKEVTEVNSEYDDQSPYISRDGKTLLISSNRDGAIEVELDDGKIGISRDLYISNWNGKAWTKPQQLPSSINTEEIEENPHLLDDTLLFTRYPFGKPEKASIYKSKRTASGWSKAEKLPAPINDKFSTISATLNDDGSMLFFSSNRPGGVGGYDLYLARIDGNSYNEVENLGEGINTQEDEAYLVYQQLQKVFYFCRRVEGKSFDIFSVTLPKPKSVIEEQFSESKKISLDSIRFERASAKLRNESKEPLDAMVSYLKDNQGIRLKIIGHTDLTGVLEDNMVLSRDRAKSVKEYLTSQGIQSNRLETDGKGPLEPLVPKMDEESSKRNRRTEFLIISD